jgi:hypothetical protein
MKIPNLIETSVLKEPTHDRVHVSTIKEIRRFYGAVNYETAIYPVKITVKVIRQEGNSNKAYSYEVMQIKSPITRTELSGLSILGGFHGDRIHSTAGL